VGNNFTNNGYDVAVYANNYNVTANFLGAERIVGNNNVISQNEISLGDYQTGFWISNSQGTIIKSNDVTLTKETTSFISTDNGNFQVYHNNFLNIEVNTGGAFLMIITYPKHVDVIVPPFDNGYPSGGNYWSDYTSRYVVSQIDDSGIGNTPYASSTTPEAIDRYPLLAPDNFAKPQTPAQTDANASPTATPQAPEFPVTLILLILPVLLFIGTLVYKRNSAYVT
jgi:hypothetical protein